jgi:hypothetical protein
MNTLAARANREQRTVLTNHLRRENHALRHLEKMFSPFRAI